MNDGRGPSRGTLLYGRRFEDKDGDPSDQPATALTACEGSFSFVLIDSERDAVLVARSAESDTHPLYWGTAPSSYFSPASEEEQGGTDADADADADAAPAPAPAAAAADDEWDGSLLLSSDLAAGRVSINVHRRTSSTSCCSRLVATSSFSRFFSLQITHTQPFQAASPIEVHIEYGFSFSDIGDER